MITLHLMAAWIAFGAGMVGGAVLGLFFWKQDFLGGYGSWPRRLLRLGHIACFGLGLLNVAFAGTVVLLHLTPATTALLVASRALLVTLVAMPLCCVLAALWRPGRHLFPIPVGALATSVVSLLLAV
jgi:hypothetical protein